MYYTDNLKQGIALGTLRRLSATRARCSPAPRQSGAGVLTYGLEYLHNDGPWDVPDNFRKVQRRAALRPAGRRRQARHHRDGLRRQVELDRPGRAARGRRRTDRPLRHARRQRRRQVAALQPVGRLRDAARRRPVPDDGVLVQVQAQSLLELHLLPRRSGQRRPVRAGRRPQRLRLDRAAGRNRASCSACRRATRWGSSCGRTASIRSGSMRRSSASGCRRRARTTSSKAAPASTRQNDTQWNDWFRSILGLRYDRYRFDVDSSIAGELGQRDLGHHVAQAVAGVRPVGQDRILRQRRLRLPQQRRARRHDQGRPEDRRSRSIRRRRWCAARAPSSACAPRRSRTCSHRWRCGI